MATVAAGSLLQVGCLQSDLLESDVFKRFRDAYAPGFVEGFSTAVSQPGQAEEGLRRSWAALFEGLGAVIETRTPAGSDSSRR
jgi:hypothetical protein